MIRYSPIENITDLSIGEWTQLVESTLETTLKYLECVVTIENNMWKASFQVLRVLLRIHMSNVKKLIDLTGNIVPLYDRTVKLYSVICDRHFNGVTSRRHLLFPRDFGIPHPECIVHFVSKIIMQYVNKIESLMIPGLFTNEHRCMLRHYSYEMQWTILKETILPMIKNSVGESNPNDIMTFVSIGIEILMAPEMDQHPGNQPDVVRNNS